MPKRKKASDSPEEEIDYEDLLMNDHGLPHKPIDDLIAERISEHGFPHPLHIAFPGFTMVNNKAASLEFTEGRLDEVEKEILSRNLEVILHSKPFKDFWQDEESRKHVIVALFGYCAKSKFYDHPLDKKDVFPTQKDRIRFRYNLGRGLPDRSLHSCYDWIRRTYNPFKNYTEEAYKNAIEDCRKVIKNDPERYSYVDISAKNEVDLRTIQSIYMSKLTATGEDPYNGLFQPVEDWIIIESLMNQAEVESYEQLIGMKQFRAKWRSISKALNYRTSQNAAVRWRRLQERIRSDDDYEMLMKLAKRYKKDVCRMIYCVYKEKDDLESQVDWHAIGYPQLTFKECVQRFQHLKTWVPEEVLAKKSHRKTTKWLYKNILPFLIDHDERKMQKLQTYYEARFTCQHP